MAYLCNNSALWDTDLAWHNTWPEFTACFQWTVLTWVPCGWLWVTSPLYLYYLYRHNTDRCLVNWPFILKMFLCSCLVLVSILQIVETYSVVRMDSFPAFYVAPILQMSTFVYALILMYIERKKCVSSSGIFFTFWLLLSTLGIVPFYTKIIQKEDEEFPLRFSVFIIHYILVLASLVCSCFTGYELPHTHTGFPSPENSASFLSRITFWWMNGLMVTGYRKVITENDVYDLHPRDQVGNTVGRFLSQLVGLKPNFGHSGGKMPPEKARRRFPSLMFNNKVADISAIQNTERQPLLGKEIGGNTDEHHSKVHIFSTIFKLYWHDLLFAQLWKTSSDVLNVANPLLLGELVRFTENKSAPVWQGYVLSLALFLSLVLQSVGFQLAMHGTTSVSVRAKAGIVSSIYRKALTLTAEARRQSTTGEIVNLMSVDTENISNFAQYLPALISSAVLIVLALIMLYLTVGPAMLAGLGLLMLVVPFNYLIVARWQRLQRGLMKLKDKRIKIVNEVLNGIKIIKLYAWEPSFQKRIMEVRNQEVNDLWWLAVVMCFILFTWTMTPYFVSLATLLTYVYTVSDHYLSPQTAFVAVSLLNVIRISVVALPDQLSAVVQARVSAKRICKYLENDDIDDSTVQASQPTDMSICVDNGAFAWGKGDNDTIRNINLKVKKGQLVAIVGQVGSGKSSLLSALLGEMLKIRGSISIKGRVAYVPQQAWIQNDSLQNNILFGKDMDEHFYNTVLECSALLSDLDILAAGDQTEIGERGINLSGGQKQRVSLARAVYSDADIYLLDDPLSAVDSHVGKHIFEKVVSSKGILGNKTRVLVTHGVQWLPKVDQIVVMVDGEVSESGTYDQLLQHDGAFAQFLHNYLLEDNDDDSVDDEAQEMKRVILERLQSVKSDTTSEDDHIAATIKTHLTRQTSAKKQEKRETKMDDISKTKTESSNTKEKNNLIKEETVEKGKVSWRIYGIYARAFAVRFAVLAISIYVFYQSLSVWSNIWLSEWTDNPDLANLTLIPGNSSERMNKNNFYLGIYGAIGVAQAVAIFTYSFLWGVRALHASRALHDGMLNNILRQPMSFYDTTPSGRIVNRFSQDMNAIDIDMPHLTKLCFYGLFETLSSLIVMAYTTPIFLVVAIPLSILYYFMQVFSINTTRQLQRLKSKSRSPIFSHFGETLLGSSVIRAFKAENRFIKDSEGKVEQNQRFSFYEFAALRWLGLRLEVMGAIITLAAAIFAVASRDNLTGGLVGLSITYGLQITGNLKRLVRMVSMVETRIVSVERVKEYSSLTEEAAWDVDDFCPESDWPAQGRVKFNNLSTRYREELDLVLKGLTFKVSPGEKVGIVGRTGAGKSSLTLSLFRLVEATGGGISIDDVDISKIGLHQLRKNITILPQDPVLFAGSLRENIDPFNQYSEADIWRALGHAHLKRFVESLPETLEHDCSEGGENISVGQRQLLCLARALLKKTKILVLDEATAAVDMETDDLIQQTIRSEFKECTVLTIAHRLNTVMDYDRILVLDNGRISEFDSPSSLLQTPSSVFYNMAKTAGLVS